MKEKINDIFVDGGQAVQAGCRSVLPHAQIHEEIWHVKKNLTDKSGKFKDRSFAKYLREIVAESSWWPTWQDR